MIYLFLSVLCSSAIFIIFKGFEKYKVNTFTAIVINYLVAGTTGLLISGEAVSLEKVFSSSWTLNAIILGFVFIALFNIMAITAQQWGASVASIANKMALIIPVLFAFFYYGDSMGAIKILGIVLALLGIYLSTQKPKEAKVKINIRLFLIPFILFLGSGFIDTFLKFTQEFHLNEDPSETKLFSSLIFFIAASIGIVVLVFNKKKRTFNLNTIFGGVILGIINYGSIYFLIQTFNNSSLESSVIFPINNMGVVILTALTSFIIFRERFSLLNKIGIAVSIIAIALIAIS